MSIIDEIKEAAKGIKNIIAVGSGKGGVGKSTVAANLAIATARQGYKTAVLDADIYGPTMPSFFGIYQKPLVLKDKMIPPEKYGIKIMSLGLMIDDFEPVIWRGPMIMGMIKQFFTDVDWGDIDYMYIDLPPGTGDAPLTIAQALPLKGAIIVATPQAAAAKTAARAAGLFKQLGTPVLGAVINMAYLKCAHCGRDNAVFSSSGEKTLTENAGLKIIARLPVYGGFMEEITPGEVRNISNDREADEEFSKIAGIVTDEIKKGGGGNERR
ncbi:MAG TPA: P-loop NTPase [Candidatus Goldiibacteriota bacterium]|nr:P-loop NTPase [Candidatus Goldiibacteriota bacterium]